MKKLLLIAAGSLTLATVVTAQIPNYGFENWTNMGNYMDPQSYLSPNSLAVSTYPITRSTDHYPAGLGSYSIRLENQPAALPNADALGLVLQNSSNVMMDGPDAAFPVTGHPNSLTGYYKYLPLNGDTMRIQVMLYSNGSEVSTGVLTSTVSAGNWTSFTIPIPSYVSADSASIMIAAYNCDGPPPAYVPHGNSVLYVDNLNFDVLLTSVAELSLVTPAFTMYPNPATDFVVVDAAAPEAIGGVINIYNSVGALVRSEAVLEKTAYLSTSDLESGIYFIELVYDQVCQRQKLVVQH